MPWFKQVWTFNSANSGNWSEVLYLESDDLAVAGQTPLSMKSGGNITLADMRMALAHRLTRLRFVTTSAISGNRETRVLQLNMQGTAESKGDQPANVGEAAVIRLSGTPAGRRFLWMRGLAEAAVYRGAASGNDHPSEDFNENLGHWLDMICRKGSGAAPYGPLTLTKPPAGGLAKPNIMTATPHATFPQWTTLTFNAAPGLEANGQVRISATKDPRLAGIGGTKTVFESSGTTATIKYKLPGGAVTGITTVTAYKVVYRTGLRFLREGSAFAYLGVRQTRNPFTGSRGARRAPRLAR